MPTPELEQSIQIIEDKRALNAKELATVRQNLRTAEADVARFQTAIGILQATDSGYAEALSRLRYVEPTPEQEPPVEEPGPTPEEPPAEPPVEEPEVDFPIEELPEDPWPVDEDDDDTPVNDGSAPTIDDEATSSEVWTIRLTDGLTDVGNYASEQDAREEQADVLTTIDPESPNYISWRDATLVRIS